VLDKFRHLFQPDDQPPHLPSYVPPPAERTGPIEITRPSNGLDQFFLALAGQDRLKILDLCGAPATTEFLFEQQQIPRPDPFYRALELAFGSGPGYLERQLEPDRVDIFVEHTLGHKEGEFDAVLLWDSLQYLRPELLEPVVEQIYSITRPGAPLLAVFHADERLSGQEEVPVFSYQVQGRNSLFLAEKDRRRPAHHFNNRMIEKIFRKFASTKFFLARDHLREVLIRR
jgi:SAM-dependent methyltransferase